MGGNWKCYSQGFDCVEESMWRAWDYCGAGGIGSIRKRQKVWDWRGKQSSAGSEH